MIINQLYRVKIRNTILKTSINLALIISDFHSGYRNLINHFTSGIRLSGVLQNSDDQNLIISWYDKYNISGWKPAFYKNINFRSFDVLFNFNATRFSRSILKFLSRYRDFNPLTPLSDQDRIFPHNISTLSTRKVMRIKKSISWG